MSAAAIMESRIAALRSAHATAVREVSTSWDLFSGSSKEANLAALEQARKRTDLLAGTNFAQVLAGTLALATWDKWAQENWRMIQSVVSDVGSWSFSGVLGATAAQTASDVQNAAQNAAAGVKPTYVAVVVVLVLLVVLKVL